MRKVSNKGKDKGKSRNKVHWEDTIGQCFCEIRNYRVGLIQSFLSYDKSRHGSLPNLKESFPNIEPLRFLRDQETLNSFYQKINQLKMFSRSQSPTPLDRLRLLIDLDECYHQIYYYAQLHHTARDTPLSVPPPHEYFTYYLYDDTSLNSALSEFIGLNFLDDFKQRISELWGLIPPSSPFPHTSPFDSNPLLRLQFSRWRETIYIFSKILPVSAANREAVLASSLSSLRSACLEGSAAKSQEMNSSSSHATMRLSGDPLLPTLQRLWFDSVRIWSCHLYAYATPTPAAIDALIRCSPLVEVGAGTGYWTKMIEQRAAAIQERGLEKECGMTSLPLSVVIQAFDKDPTASRANSYHGRSRSWSLTISPGNSRDSILSAHRRLCNSDSCSSGSTSTPLSLFLCYPPPDSEMALQTLRQFLSLNGQTVCYVGEYRGDTGSRPFEKLLESTFDCAEEITLPNWGDTAYSLTIWRKRVGSEGEGATVTEIVGRGAVGHPCRRCCVCGGQSPKREVSRCRVSYAVSFCGGVCAGTTRGKEIYRQELSYRCLYSGRSSDSQAEDLRESAPLPVAAVGGKKRKKSNKLVRELTRSDSESETEDIRTQLKRYRQGLERGKRDSTSASTQTASTGKSETRQAQHQEIEFSSQWFMTL